MFTKNNINSRIIVQPTNFVGGDTKRIQPIFNNNLSIKREPIIKPKKRVYMEKIINDRLKKTIDYHPQFDLNQLKELTKTYGILDPKTLTFEDIRNHAEIRQNLSHGYIDKCMGYLSQMANHPVYKIDFNESDPESFTIQYFRYMDHIKKHGDFNKKGNLKPVGVHGLANRDKSILVYLRSIGRSSDIPRYKDITKLKIPDNTLDIPVPAPEIVNKMISFDYVDKHTFNSRYKSLKKQGIRCRDLNRLIQYHFFFGFFVGMAPPKEMCILNVSDLTLQPDGKYILRITRPKVGFKKRRLPLEKTISSSKVHKSVYNYLKFIRPKFVDKNESALFVNPNTGKRWDTDPLRRFLNRYGSRVYPEFYPYLMRHWCGTARMNDWDKNGNAFSRVQYWLGHKDPKETTRYVKLKTLFEGYQGSWLGSALKPNIKNNLGEMQGLAQEPIENNVVVHNISNDSFESPQARSSSLKGFCTSLNRIFVSCAIAANNHLTKTFLFSFCGGGIPA